MDRSIDNEHYLKLEDDHVSNSVNSSLFVIHVVRSDRTGKLTNIARYIYIWWENVGNLSSNALKW